MSLPHRGLSERIAGWEPAVADELASRAQSVAHTVATRLTTDEKLAKAIVEVRQQSAFPNRISWTPYSLSQGHAGLALLCGYMDACCPGERWDLKGREHLEVAVQSAEVFPNIAPGLFSGLSGLAFAAWQISRGGTRYRRLLASLDQVICARALDAVQKVKGDQGIDFSDFDAISGLSGVGAYLLCRQQEPHVTAALVSVVEGLVEFVSQWDELPPWYTPPHFIADEKTREYCPHGNLNFGLAHGIPGPLALFALAQAQGVSVAGLEEAITQIADWLYEHRCDDEWGVNWPSILPLTRKDGRLSVPDSQLAPEGPSRSAWCYGSPGIARALWLAGEALSCERYKAIAVSAMEAVFRRPISKRRIDSPTFCHGVAGLLAVTLRFHHDVGGTAFSTDIGALVHQLLAKYRPESLLGFRHIETRQSEIDQPGLLEGAPGVSLALLAATTHAEPNWDRLFLLS